MAYLAIDGEDWSDRVRFLMHDELQKKISMATLGSPDAVADGLKDEWLRVAWEDEDRAPQVDLVQRPSGTKPADVSSIGPESELQRAHQRIPRSY